MVTQMEDKEIAFVKECIRRGNLHSFYNSQQWKQTRRKVLQMDKYECQICKSHGRYTKATTVHHINYVKKHPELALEVEYSWKGRRKRNLISLCHDCHEEVHGHRKKSLAEPLTKERWE